MLGWLAAAMNSFDLCEAASDHSMLDWPEPIHTSPTSTSVSSTLFLPRTVSVWPLLLASKAGRTTFQLPLSSAFVLAVLPPNSTVTSSPASAQPQMGSGLSRWRTMWLPRMAGSLTSARADGAAAHSAARAMNAGET